jgi:hypothetical protein
LQGCSQDVPSKGDFMKTVIGLFDYASDAYGAQGDLLGSGLQKEQMSVLTSPANLDFHAKTADEGKSEAAEGAGIGATAGAIAGGAAGLLASLGLLAIPGIGPLLAAGPIVAILAGAGVGAAAGGLVGGLIGLGIPEHEAEIYAEGVNRGGTLLSVDAADADADRIAAVLSQHNAVDIDKRAAEWESAGWKRKYTSAGVGASAVEGGASVDPRTRGVDRAEGEKVSRPVSSSARIYNPT